MPDEHDLTHRDLLVAAAFVPLADLPAEKRDLVLKAIDENPTQGRRARRLTLEGMFGDLYYGGKGACSLPSL